MQSRFADRYYSRNLTPISVIIPCFNETRGTLIRAMDKLQNILDDYLLDVIIVENGTDNLDGLPNSRYYFVEKGGLGIALKMGLLKAAEEKAFFLPADMSFDLSFVDFAILEKDADMVIASKFIPGSSVKRPFPRQLMSRAYHFKNRYLDGIKGISDLTGAKMFKRSSVLPLLNRCTSPGIGFEVQLIREMQRAKLRIKEIPAIVHDYGKRGILRWL